MIFVQGFTYLLTSLQGSWIRLLELSYLPFFQLSGWYDNYRLGSLPPFWG
jgi:hypothetical protein